MTEEMFEVSWDRGKKTREEAKELNCFDFICEGCSSKNISLTPIEVPWLHSGYAENLPAKYVRALELHAKPLLEALFICTDVAVKCDDCGIRKNYIKSQVRDENIKKWYNEKFNKGGINLTLKGEEEHGEEASNEETCDEETSDN